jgi:glycosyltransferase involved in cell wall biosynthesis
MGVTKVSVLVPVYGTEAYIERCAISLFEQDYENVEFIFVNDCTNDSSIIILRDVIARYPHRIGQIRIIDHLCNQGLAAARRTALMYATGEYILNVDSDDFLEPLCLSTIMNMAVKSNTDIVYFDYYKYNNGYRHIVRQKKIVDNIEYIKLILELDLAACVWNKLIRRELYIDNGILPVVGVDTGEDLITTVPLIYKTKKILYVDTPLYNYVYNPKSYTNNINRKAFEDVAFIVNYFSELFNENVDILSSLGIYNYKQRALMLLSADDETYKLYKKNNHSIAVNKSAISPVYRLISIFNEYNMRLITKIAIRVYNYIRGL